MRILYQIFRTDLTNTQKFKLKRVQLSKLCPTLRKALFLFLSWTQPESAKNLAVSSVSLSEKTPTQSRLTERPMKKETKLVKSLLGEIIKTFADKEFYKFFQKSLV